MNKYYFEGKTEEQAINTALEELKLSKEDLIVNSIEDKSIAADILSTALLFILLYLMSTTKFRKCKTCRCFNCATDDMLFAI